MRLQIVFDLTETTLRGPTASVGILLALKRLQYILFV